MKHSIVASFPGGKRVLAHLGDQVIATDQTVANGGEGTAPEPFSLFLASLATCAGLFAFEFCQARKVDTTDLKVELVCDWDEPAHRYTSLELRVTPPKALPEKFYKALERSVNLCSVKRHLLTPPELSTTIVPVA